MTQPHSALVFDGAKTSAIKGKGVSFPLNLDGIDPSNYDKVCTSLAKPHFTVCNQQVGGSNPSTSSKTAVCLKSQVYGRFLCFHEIVQGTVQRECRHGFSGCSMNVPLHHFKAGMA